MKKLLYELVNGLIRFVNTVTDNLPYEKITARQAVNLILDLALMFFALILLLGLKLTPLERMMIVGGVFFLVFLCIHYTFKDY